MKRNAWVLVLSLVAVAQGRAQPAVDARPPALVVLIAVDQLRQDYLERFRGEFTGGFARLLRSGAVFTQAFQDHGITETAPGHASMLSGRYPYSTGIVRNDEGVPDRSVDLVGLPGTGASPHRFRGTALLDWMRARWPAARMLSVSRKDRSAILPVGRSREGVTVLWYVQGRITTSSYYADTLPAWVRRFDSASARAKRPGLVWNLLRAPSRYGEPDSVVWERRGRAFTFPYTLAADSLIYTMPWMDSLTLALALEGVARLGLGRSDTPDVVSVGLSTLDNVGHDFGPDSREVHDMMLRLDRYLGAFLAALERRVGRGRVVLALTGDHGVTARPEASWARGEQAGFVVVDSILRPVLDTLSARAGVRALLYREVGMVALDRARLAGRGVNVDSLAADLAARIRVLPGVVRVDTRASLAGADTTSHPAVRRWVRMLAPDTPGEVFITLAPLYYVGRPRNFTHGQPSDDDAHVPLILMGPGIRPGVYGAKAAVVDLGPTLAAVVGVTPTEPVDGRVLREALR